MDQMERAARIAIGVAEATNTPAARQLGERIAQMIRHHAPKSPGEDHIEIASILSTRTKQGMVEVHLNGESTQFDIAKAREVRDMLQGAIEAAITDTILYQFMKEKVGITEENRLAQILLDFRELRQGSKSVVYPS